MGWLCHFSQGLAGRYLLPFSTGIMGGEGLAGASKPAFTFN